MNSFTIPSFTKKCFGREWLFLEKLLDSGHLLFIDYLVAHTLLKKIGSNSEAIAAFLCHLNIAARLGHLCVKIEENKISPEPKACWVADKSQAETIKAIEKETLQKVSALILEGARLLPNELISECAADALPPTPLCRYGQRYYFQRFWRHEQRFLQPLFRLAQTKPKASPDFAAVEKELETREKEGKLLFEQKEAIKAALFSSLSLISGGPGTGKTYTAGQLIHILLKTLPKEALKTYHIALAAPTGKAAMNLEWSLNKALTSCCLDATPKIQGKTLHALLGLKAAAIGKDNSPRLRLPADMIIVDESSMIDVVMMGHLFEAVKPGAQLILLGDEHQLPSIAAGNTFRDCLEAFSSAKMPSVSVAFLNKCMRTELQTILSFADKIKRGESHKALSLLDSENQSALRYQTLELLPHNLKASIDAMHAKLLRLAEEKFSYLNQANPEDIGYLVTTLPLFRILTPFRKGAFGVEALNALFLKQMKGKKNEIFIAPIMLTANDWNRELFNGEIGLLVKHFCQQPLFSTEDYAIFLQSGQQRKIPALALPHFEYAYCMSIHKSQGSEFDHVVLLLPEGSELFGREVLYTGVTRAKKILEIWSTPTTLNDTILSKEQRESGLVAKLSGKQSI